MNKIKLKVVSTFSGVGMERRGIENTGLFEIEQVATCETDANAIISYAAIHNNLTDELVESYNNYPEREHMAKELEDLHINYDFVKKKEYSWKKIAKSKDSKNQLKKTWLSCKLNKNYGDISRVEIFPKCDLLTFSFPCTDLSVAGKQKGMIEGETRSGLVYEVIRIIKNMKNEGIEPDILLMENVDALINKKNKESYDLLNKKFLQIGYDVKYDVINAKFTGVPQNRNRVFALYYKKDIDMSKFEFPKKFDNGIRLIDVLEDDVDEKYYINNEKSDRLINDLLLNGKISYDDDDYEEIEVWVDENGNEINLDEKV